MKLDAGDTRLYHQLYAGGPLAALFRESYARGFPVAGVSAGALISLQYCQLVRKQTTTTDVEIVAGLGLARGFVIGAPFSQGGWLPIVLETTARSRPSYPLARREYEAHCLPFHDFAHAVGSLVEAGTVLRRLWTETKPLDFPGTYLDLTGAFCNPKPTQRPHPPILIGVLGPGAAHSRRARRPVEHPRRRHRRRHPPQRTAGPLLC